MTGEDRGDHAALMDKVYRHQRHIYDLTRKYYLRGRDRLIRELGAKPSQRVVEIGCGTARNLVKIARAYPEARLYGLDASQAMLRTAADTLRRGGLENRVLLAHDLAEQMTPALFGLGEPFDHAIFSYSLSMIPDWRGALAAAAKALAPQGLVHIVDFGDFGGLTPAAARALRAWLGLFHVAPRNELIEAVELALGPAALHHIGGRYAFLLQAKPEQIRRIAGTD
jgi:S-adenosylmethionine-diacylgycerolhomoserine-N-methlytransferase